MPENAQEIAGRRGMNTGVHSSSTGGRRHCAGQSIVRVLDTARPRIERAARLAMANPTRRSLLKRLVLEDGVTYRDLIKSLPVSERWVRELVADLRREGVVKTPGNPATIAFASEKIRVAVQEVLAFLASDWAENTATDSGTTTGLSSLSASTTGSSSSELKKYLQSMGKLLRGKGWSP